MCEDKSGECEKMKESDRRILKELENEPIEERFPTKKEFDINKEVETIIEEMSFIVDYFMIVERLRDGEHTKEDIINLHEYGSRIALVSEIAKRIKEKLNG